MRQLLHGRFLTSLLKKSKQTKNQMNLKESYAWELKHIDRLVVRVPTNKVHGVFVEACYNADGSRTWQIRQKEYYLLGRDKIWIYEPNCSNRPDNFEENYRWNNAREAFYFARNYLQNEGTEPSN